MDGDFFMAKITLMQNTFSTLYGRHACMSISSTVADTPIIGGDGYSYTCVGWSNKDKSEMIDGYRIM